MDGIELNDALHMENPTTLPAGQQGHQGTTAPGQQGTRATGRAGLHTLYLGS